jgi:hypothetical protein
MTQCLHVKHAIREGIHELTFPNLLNIPRENYPKFFQRMLQVYGEILQLEFKEETKSFNIVFENNIPNRERLQELLSKFSIRNYTLIEL